MTKILLNDHLVKQITKDTKLRTSLTTQSAAYFATVYFPHYFTHALAPFQQEMIGIIEDEACEFSVIVTFRGSGKSTFFTTIAPLWYIMGVMQKKYVVIVCQTQEQAKAHLANIKSEVESNPLLEADLGPFKPVGSIWNALTLEFERYNSRITAVSIDQSIRGLRFKQYRPDVIICDDIEDSSSVKTKEGRKRISELYSGEIAPLGDLGTRTFMVGNYLHPNSLLTTLRETIKAGKLRGRQMFVPLINDERQIAWPQKFPDMEDIYELKAKVANSTIWAQEYLLKVVPDDDQLVAYQDIHWYDSIPTGWEPLFCYRAVGVDLAISQDDRSDYTTAVSASVYSHSGEYHVFIDPNPLNKRLKFRPTIDYLMKFNDYHPGSYLFIESTGYQSALVEQLCQEGVEALEVKIGNLTKAERLAVIVPWIKRGLVHFPQDGATDLVNQTINLGIELHDDLVDALTILVSQIMKYAKDNIHPPSIRNSYPKFVEIEGGMSLRDAMVRQVTNWDEFNVRTLEHDPYGWSTRSTRRF
ncbi:MAG: hypothetical protein V1487_01345 [bacterium]